MKVALVHDWMVNLSGAERVLKELHEMYPEAPIYTLFAHKKFVRQYFPYAYVRPSFLQLIPGITKLYKYFFFLMPTAIESFDLSDYDVVISSSAIFSKGLVLKPKTRHICYCYSPTRQIWDLNGQLPITNYQLPISLGKHLLRLWDRQASDRVDYFVAISKHVRNRINKYYRKDSVVIYPPVNLITNYQLPITNKLPITPGRAGNYHLQKDYYLIVSRLYKHKNIDIVIEAFNKLKLPLIIIGTGPEYKNLKSKILNPKSIKLLGFIPDRELSFYYQNCRAFIMPQEEDFGITPIEAMSFGKPVLALRRGGAIETVVEGKTGEFFDDPIPEGLADGIRRLNENYNNYDGDKISLWSQRFSKEKFRREFRYLVKQSFQIS